ncbi:MAG: hypothetical protein KGJ23_08870 [Euryarchaeota archaeon]|nr:hypothetical protein [Euryarchaeota archaeon]MDE1836716.1 hypothetical protein [Euryarchaeota archaeon]MDE1881745.1 hypothetical protein [Euryarchaeota archaeon]MDE2044700.1 hypothetical protein [Thermoplasmata archaeon]
MHSGTATTITVPSSVLSRLKVYKVGGKTYAEVLKEFMDAIPPAQFLAWAEEELRRPAVPYLEARPRLGLRRD